MNITILEPIWDGEKVGINRKKIVSLKDGESFYVQISYQDHYGNKVFPHKYWISKEKALEYPIKYLKNHTIKLHIIPISDFEVK